MKVDPVTENELDGKQESTQERRNFNNSISVYYSDQSPYLTEEQDNIFYKVPNRIVSQVEGCPSILNHISLSIGIDDESIDFQAQPPPDSPDPSKYTVNVHVERLFRSLEKEGIPFDSYDEILLSLRTRPEIVTRAIRNYISRNIIITNLQLENNKKQWFTPKSNANLTTRQSDQLAPFGLFDINGSIRKRKVNLLSDEESCKQSFEQKPSAQFVGNTWYLRKK